MVKDLLKLPENLPVPEDDGEAAHLIGTKLPNVSLKSIGGSTVNLSELQGWQVIYCYPLTGQPNMNLPENWDAIPGARGCTPQACSFRDSYKKLNSLQIGLIGISSQRIEYQREMASRLHIPFTILSDAEYQFVNALELPTFWASGHRFMKRITLITHFGNIRHVNYPVFPPDKEPERVINWLENNIY